MERIAAEPEVTVRRLMTDLAERGVAVSYGTVWNFIHREGMSFKKSVLPTEQRSPRRGAPPRALEKISDED
jgi:transposase